MTKTDKPDDYDRVAVETASITYKLGYSAGVVTECEAIARLVEELGAATYDGKVYARDIVGAIRARGGQEIDLREALKAKLAEESPDGDWRTPLKGGRGDTDE